MVALDRLEAPRANGTARASHVGGQVDRLNRLTEDLHKAIAMQEQRIERVLRIMPQAPKDTGTKEQAQLVSHATDLAAIADAVEVAIRRLVEITDRVEL